MPLFKYEISDETGRLSKGQAEADTAAGLISRLRAQDRWVLSLRPTASRKAGGGLTAVIEGVQRTLQRWVHGVSLKLLLLFTGQASTMLASGLHLTRVLTTLGNGSTNAHFRKTLHDVSEALTAGTTFASALEQHPHIFDRLYVEVVRAGELSGSLPTVLNTLRIYLEKSARTRRKIIGAITYPAVILAVAIVIVIVILVKLVPIFEAVYTRANTALPGPTRALLRVSNLIRDQTLSVVMIAGLLAVLFFMAIQTRTGRTLLDAAKLRLPLFGELIRKGILARVCRTLNMLLSGGIPLLEGLQTTAQVSNNKVIENALLRAMRQLREGDTVGETLAKTGQFPTMVIQLVTTGEESGTLPEMLGRAAEYYEQEVDEAVATLSTLIEPVMIVATGALIGTIIFALYLPIFNIGQAIKGSLH
jgi:type IV pilus assembly protein PilC